MRRGRMVMVGVWAAAVASGLGCPSARAQSSGDKAAAEALFDEGKRLFLAKKFAEACPRFEASNRLDPGIGTRLYLADCYENNGQIASAWAMFREAAAAAKSAGQGGREAVARKRAARLEPRLFRLTLRVGAGAGGLRVTRDQVEVKEETWNEAVPVDPGAYTITAAAPGKKPWSTKVDVPDGPGEATVAIPPLEDDPAAVAAVQAPPGPAAPPPRADAGLGKQRLAGIVVGGAGVVTLGIAGVLAGVAAAKSSDAKARCPDLRCGDQTGVDLSRQAGATADAATVLVVLGGAAAAAGIVTFFTAPRRAPAERAWIAPVLGPGAAGISAGRAW